MSFVVFEAPIEERVFWLQIVRKKSNEGVEEDVPVELRVSFVD